MEHEVPRGPSCFRHSNGDQVPNAVDTTDWLKTAAIILVSVDHFGYFFMEDDLWWSVFGRLAAPPFFFLMGYAQTRAVPPRWIWLGVILSLLESSNTDWGWVAPNILLSFALVRLARPHVQSLVQRHGWLAIALLLSALFAVLPIGTNFVDYGAAGWLWALFGMCQRLCVDGKSVTDGDDRAQSPAPPAHAPRNSAGLMRLLVCIAAAVVYIWQEQKEYSFPHFPAAVFILGVAGLCFSLCRFRRGPSRIQPQGAIAATLRFCGRHTLEIYAIQLAASELIVRFVPDLAP